jgi:hypothetical protein
MANQLPLTIDFGSLPTTGAGYTPQQLLDRAGLNGRIFTEQTFALFTSGTTAPTSDTGPWVKNGNTWYYWSNGTGSYVPFLLEQESLAYFIGAAAPDQNIYQFWIETAGNGSPLALKTYYNGAWTDVYATVVSNYLTTAAAAATYLTIANAAATYLTTVTAAATYLTQANAGTTYLTQANAATTYATQALYSTTAVTTAAIAAAVASYPASATHIAPQTVAVTGAAIKCTLDTVHFNPAPIPFNTTTYRYIAPVDGYYLVTCSTQIDNATGTAATMQCILSVYKNGSDYGSGGIDATPSPNGARWAPTLSTMVKLLQNEYVEVFLTCEDGVDTGNVTLTDIDFSVVKVSS